MPGTEVVSKATGTQSARISIERWQATVAQWVALRPLFDVYSRGTGYTGGGRRREAWWQQEATKIQFRATLADSQEAKRRMRIGGEMGTQ